MYAILIFMGHYIAVDIGGTQLRAACYSPGNTSPAAVHRTPTIHASTTPLERLIELIHSVWPGDEQVTCISAAAPGPVDPYEGILFEAPNIPGWVNLPLKKYLEDHFEAPVYLGNDANLAALGEWKYGAGQGHHHLVYLTVSTGVGGGVILDDRLVLGTRGLAGELGHITVLPNGPLCSCGKPGHLEAVASGPAIARWVEQELNSGASSSLPAGETLNAKQIGEAAKNGDALALAAYNRAGTFIGQAIADFMHVFNPSIVIIGGGVSRSGQLLFEPIRASLRERVVYPQYLENFTLTTAALRDDAGLLGALAFAQTSSAT